MERSEAGENARLSQGNWTTGQREKKMTGRGMVRKPISRDVVDSLISLNLPSPCEKEQEAEEGGSIPKPTSLLTT